MVPERSARQHWSTANVEARHALAYWIDTRFAGLTIIEVAARCGFLEPSHFARRFRKAYGVGPTQFRAARS